jgi:hypothetical protein
MKQHLTVLKIKAIQSGEARLVVDDYGRVHSPLTNLRRAVRPALRINDQALVEIDVSNAQPLLLGFLVAKLLAGDWSLSQVKRLGSKGPFVDPFGGMELKRWSNEVPPDLLDYIGVCERGAFYQTVAEVWSTPCESRKQKNEIKRLVFRRLLFGRVAPGRRHWIAFRRRWPSVALMLDEIKRPDHGTSARACQRIESRLMIQGVADRLRRQHPEVQFQTIHDSVLTLRDTIQVVKEVMRAEFGAIGLVPRFKEAASQGRQCETNVIAAQEPTGT